jgi:hypothetical protein
MASERDDGCGDPGRRRRVAGGSAVLGAALLLIGAALRHDSREDVDFDSWARRGGLWAGVAGLVVFLDGA